VDHW